MTTLESAEILFEKSADIPVHKDAANIDIIAENEAISVFIEQFDTAIPQPGVPRMSYYWPITDTVFGLVFDGKMTPEEAQAKTIADYEALVASE